MQEVQAKLDVTNEGLLRIITDSLPVLVAYIDKDLRYVFINKTYEIWFRCQRSEMQGHKLIDVLSPAIYQTVLPFIQKALTGQIANYDVKVPSRFGGYRYIEGTYTPDFAPDGSVRGVISHIVDVSEKKTFEIALHKSQDRDQFLAEAGELLTSRLELRQIYSVLEKLIIPKIADGFSIEMLQPAGSLQAVAKYSVSTSVVLYKDGDLSIDFEKLNSLGFLTAVAVPLKHRGKVSGILACLHKNPERQFETDDVSLLESLAYRLSLAVENASLYAETKKQKDRLYQTLMRAPMAICVRRGPQFIYELVNEPYQRSIGLDRDVIGKPYLEVFPEASPEVLEILQRCAGGGERISKPEFSLILDWDQSGNKTEKVMNLEYEPIFGPDGKPEGVISFGYEITEQVMARRKVEAIAEKFRILTETIPQMVWTASAEGKPQYYNQRWYEYTGMKERQSFESKESEVIHQEDLPRFMTAWKNSVSTGLAFECELRICRQQDHQYRWFMARALPVRDEAGKIEKWFGTCTEIQEQKELEENLIKARLGAERASLAKSNFLANMSHEIRTPMTAVLGFAEFLRDPSLTDDERMDCLHRIERSGRSLLMLIDDILDISKIEAGQLQIENYTFSVVEVVSEVVGMFRLQATQKSLAIRAVIDGEVPEQIASDPTRLRQILVNLIGNAVKFTKEGEITVTLRFHKKEEKNVLSFEVKDTGIGIALEDQSKLFSAFVQADDSITRKFGGSGLGLALSKRLAEKLGGNLELAASSLGKGSLFAATIDCGPLAGVSWTRVFPAEMDFQGIEFYIHSDSQKPLEGLSVLLTEDFADNRALLVGYLQSAGAVVDVAVNGKQAVDRCLMHHYDVILMDLQMPVMDGVEATRRLRQQGFTGPIIALTAHAMKEDREISLNAGCSDHLTKPIARGALIQSILRNRTKEITCGLSS